MKREGERILQLIPLGIGFNENSFYFDIANIYINTLRFSFIGVFPEEVKDMFSRIQRYV